MTTNSTENKKKLFLDKFAGLKFNITKTAKAIGISRRTYTRWINKDDDFLNRVVLLKESLVDQVESKLIKIAKGFTVTTTTTKTKQLRNGEKEITTIKTEKHYPPNFSAIKLFLEAQARHRGYGMKLDDSDADQHDEQPNIVFTDEID